MKDKDQWKDISETLGRNNYIKAKAPGRINLIGEHTDYNGGYVLPAAIDKYCYFGFLPNDSNVLSISALDLDEQYEYEISNLQKTNVEWANFLIGIILQFNKRPIALKGMKVAFYSDVPMGAGMSSSSALECAFIKGLDHIYQTGLTNWEMIEISKRSNHDFLGLKGGIMDQFSALFGKENSTMLLDCDLLQFEYKRMAVSDYSWLLINTCVKHNNLTNGYADRVNECKEALAVIQQTHPDAQNISFIKDVRLLDASKFDNEEVWSRASFVIEENVRVLDFCRALENDQYGQCGQLLYASHHGLAHKYAVSCDELDYLVDLLRDDKEVLGSRMMGGGFGGCTINLVKKSAINAIKEKVAPAYESKFGIKPKFHEVRMADGASVIG